MIMLLSDDIFLTPSPDDEMSAKDSDGPLPTHYY